MPRSTRTKAAIIIQKYWRGTRTRTKYSKLRGLKISQTLQDLKAGTRDPVKDEIQFYRKALNTYNNRKITEGMINGIDSRNITHKSSNLVKHDIVDDADSKSSQKKGTTLRQIGLARNRRARQIPEE